MLSLEHGCLRGIHVSCSDVIYEVAGDEKLIQDPRGAGIYSSDGGWEYPVNHNPVKEYSLNIVGMRACADVFS